MRFIMIAATLLATCNAAPAAAQTIAITPAADWKACAVEDKPCAAPANALVRYGAGAKFVYRVTAGTIECSNAVFGDPIEGTVKACAYAVPASSGASSPAPTPTATPLPAPVPTATPVGQTEWVECAKEGEPCAIKGTARVRFGANGKYVWRDARTAILCSVGAFGGDPISGVGKSCAYDKNTFAPALPPATPAAARDRLGINVSGVSYYGGEPVFANQLRGLSWLVPNAGWGNIAHERLRPDGFPLVVDGSAAAPNVVSIFNPPVEAWEGDMSRTRTRCTWQGTGRVGLGGGRRDIQWGDHFVVFEYTVGGNGQLDRHWLEISESKVTDPIRAVDCRVITDRADAFFAPQLLDYLKPFGVLRFLDLYGGANGNPGSLTWANRTQPDDFINRGPDGFGIENTLKLVNATGASPWYTIAWNADADYHRRMAQMVHDTLPAGRQVYVEVSNEVWNYSFGQAHQAQAEGLERGLSTNGFGANLNRYAQKIMEVMPIWSDVFKDRPGDLVRVAATQSANVWVGSQIFEWKGGAAAPYIDAVAIAPYFSIDPTKDDSVSQDANLTALAADAKKQISFYAAEYKKLADNWGKRLIAYEGGQHQLDPDNLARLERMNRDPRMEGIYRQYLTDWNALTGDLFTLYAATGSISRFGAWGLREHAGQPIAETPKLRGVMSYKPKPSN